MGQYNKDSRPHSHVKPVAVLITTKVYLKYRVTSLTTKTSITYSVKPEQKPLIKFGSAILKIVTRLFIPVKAASKPVPLTYHTAFTYTTKWIACILLPQQITK